MGDFAPHLDAAGASHTGLVRDENQDAFAVRPALGFYALADGISGRPFGQLAAQMTIDAAAAHLREHGAPPDARLDARELRARLVGAVEHANERVYHASGPERRGMATTFVGMLVRGFDLCLLHLGDSRAYRLRDGALSALTEDHSVGNALIARGLPEEEVLRRPNRNAITRAVGLVPRPAMTVRFETAAPGDAILLSSDGLHRVVAEDEIAAIVASVERADVAVERLIAKANERGGPDNTTAIVVRWPSASLLASRAGEPGVTP
jgi:protein phosphatase